MRWFIVILGMMITWACQRNNDSWPEDREEKQVEIYVRTGNSGVMPSGYQLFVYDAEKQQTTFYGINPESGKENWFSIGLLPGTYTGYCVVNATESGLREYGAQKGPAEIYIKLEKEGNTYLGNRDYLLGHSDFTVGVEEQNPVVFDLERKVTRLQLVLENIPDWVTDMTLHVSGVPEKMNLLGEYSQAVCTVEKTMEIPVNGNTSTSLLVFPPTENCTLTLSYKVGSATYTTPPHALMSLPVNRTTEIRALFGGSKERAVIDFEIHQSDWEVDVIQGEDWYIDMPQSPCTGQGNGVNLVENGGFEGEVSGEIPDGWKLEAGGADKKIVRVTEPVAEGSKAVRLEGKTYLYQDITIEEGCCYQLSMNVNSISADTKWRYWCTWMDGSRSLASDEIRSSAYQYQTEGYTDVFGKQLFRAPAGATKLRMEIRTYSSWEAGVGLYVDKVSVEKVEP